MDWYWILYWCGFPIAYGLAVWAMGTEAANTKRKLQRLRAKQDASVTHGWDIHNTETTYFWNLAGILFLPPLVALLWPGFVVLGLCAATVMSIGWLLDAAVSAFMEDSPNE